MSYILNKKLVLCIIFDKLDSQNQKNFEEKESIEILKIFGLIKNMERYQIIKQLL